jgi:DNA-dependent RNA polymerase auxiliary subunit epsilon
MTFLGLLILIAVLGAWVYAAIRVTPAYLEYMKIAGTLEKVRDEYSANPGTTDFMIRKAIERHFDIEMVTAISNRDILIERAGDVFNVTASYEDVRPFAYNIDFLMTFDKTVQIPVR